MTTNFKRYALRFVQVWVFLWLVQGVYGAELWVSPQGSAQGDGSMAKPYATLDQALRKARELRRLEDPAIASGITIYLKGGVYPLAETVFIRPEDSGTASSPTVIRAADGEQPILSGGRRIDGWKRARNVSGLPKAAAGQVWVADAPRIGGNLVDFRQLWVDGAKATRSKSHNGTSMGRIRSWNHAEETCWIPLPRQEDFHFEEGMELFIHQWWAIAVLRIKEALVQGDSVKLGFYQPESRIQSEHPWPAPWISAETGNSAFVLTNSIQFLDEPGEWFLDKRAGKLYYWPRKGEDMADAEVTYPYLETLVSIQGSIDYPVKHVHFDGVTFQHSTWLRPSQQGHVPLQAGMYLLDAYKLRPSGTPDKKSLENQAWVGRPSAAVRAIHSAHTAIENCRFEHLAATGLDYAFGNDGDRAEGNVLKDIGGSGILVGKFSDEAVEAHLPYHPVDEREVSRNVHIANNVITDVTNEDWGAVGIGAGFVRDVNIAHNDISEVSYTGISVGWGWTPTVNVMRNNRIVSNRIHRYGKHMYDVAGIYTLSAQPGTRIAGNRIDSIYRAPYAHLPDHWFYLYTDEGTSYVTVTDNWYPSDKTLQNANGPGNTWKNNGPDVDPAIRGEAGLQPAYRHLLTERAPYDARYEINTHTPFTKPVLVQVEAPGDGSFDEAVLRAVAQKQGDDDPDIRQWKSRYVLITDEPVAKKVHSALAALYPAAKATLFNDLFYAFDRTRCGEEVVDAPVDHVLLTASLVKDARKQHEYYAYHERQFEEWPEVSAGFCNAGFIDVLLYRNGDQLMLMITYPEGEDYEQLNAKTTEDNPRVDEWNRIMAEYQEGVAGTAPGETWVFFR